ncbi:hypothetical protein GCM10020229_64770 [Kitasatospora albolonga]|uniref:hypothetical protein n=1 Tax=Kitasatospora albolonga TaxID=68173 RepID=UPI0031EEE2BD
MKYVAMIYGNQAKWEAIPAEEWPSAIARRTRSTEVPATGELIGAYGLADAASAQLVRRQDGARRSPTGRTWRPRSTWPASTC